MKLAVLIGVSDYTQIGKLEICENDLKIMTNVLNNIAKYDDVISIDSKTANALETKEKLSDFVNQNKNKQIEELFFYFSGHGDYQNNEFYYLLKDYCSEKKNQTSISNSDMDNMFKSLNPNLMIKVVDACFSGIQYIKSSDTNCIRKYLEDTSKSYNNCYFMFSSQRNQTSLITGKPLSDFTYSFLNSIIKTKATNIKYKHIIDYVSDDFSDNKEQTPYFIAQADYTENFLNITDEQKQSLENLIFQETKKVIQHNSSHIIEDNHQKVKTLTDIITEDNNRYVSQEQAYEVLNHILENLTKYKLCGDLKKLYEIKISKGDSSTSPREFQILATKNIGKWLSENKHNLFAQPDYKKEEYTTTIKVPIKNNLASLLMPNYTQNYEEKEITRTRDVIDSFNSTIEQPFYLLRIYLNPVKTYQNLKPFDLTIVFLMSKTTLQCFYYFASYNEISWGQYKPINDVDWKIQRISFVSEEQHKSIIDSILKEFNDYVLLNLKKDFGYNDNIEETADI